MSDEKLKKLKEAWNKMEEGTKGYGGGSGGITPKAPKKGEVKPVAREEGANGAKQPKAEDYGKKGGVDGSIVKGNSRKEGAAEGNKEVGEEHGTKKPAGDAKPVARDEGAAAGAKEVGEFGGKDAFRKKIKGVLGLPLNDKLNQVGKGLNKG